MKTQLTLLATLALTGLTPQAQANHNVTTSYTVSTYSAEEVISSANCQCPICRGLRMANYAPVVTHIVPVVHLSNLPPMPGS
jgi:hypothetical protein